MTQEEIAATTINIELTLGEVQQLYAVLYDGKYAATIGILSALDPQVKPQIDAITTKIKELEAKAAECQDCEAGDCLVHSDEVVTNN